MNLKIVRTNDGSDTIYNKALDESYHSLYGSIKESEHVYINAGLDRVVNNKKNNSGTITLEYKGIDQLDRLVEIIKENY